VHVDLSQGRPLDLSRFVADLCRADQLDFGFLFEIICIILGLGIH
jgi:hypothetical protein